MSENDFDTTLDELVGRSVDRLLKADTFDQAAFGALIDHLWRKAERLQHEHCLSKQILRTIRSAIAAIRSRAEYMQVVRGQLHLANEFELMLDRLIEGETRSSRVPGVPRVI
ncbi:hypothetical protein [Pandoraea pneumonica]|uniref:hypothetical protein n=1 Tax=Pandoraea pneumonica TaxID=2508299 RepID=UPI001C2D258D|nr:hypothetical protein [Pandoraea pneumonica]